MNQKTLKVLACFLGILMVFSTISLASAAKIEIIYSGTGGDITKNKRVYNNIPKTTITRNVLAYAKKGTPMVTFGSGKGPKVMIVAGVHGNELPASIAAMKLINYLNKRSIKGTVYVIPFVAPYSTSKSTRFWRGRNLNSVANKARTPTNKIVRLSKKLKIKALADFHSTRPGGVPGRNSILATKYPSYQSYRIASYISKKTGHALIYEYRAGVSYPGAVEDACNLVRVPAVTCEVKSRHGTVASGSVYRSYKQMLTFLKYEKVI